MIVVTGATGQLGSQIVDRLLDRLRPTPSASACATSRAAGLAERGVRVRAGDFTDPATPGARLRGCGPGPRRVGRIRGGGAFEANRAAIDAAQAAGASASCTPATRPRSPGLAVPAQPTHAATEEHLAGWASPSRPCATASTPARSASTSARR